MEKKMNNEELQSRREFFKKAAKSALPIIATVALASNPTLASAAKMSGGGCNCTSCVGSCTGGCTISCEGPCAETCTNGCKNTSKSK